MRHNGVKSITMSQQFHDFLKCNNQGMKGRLDQDILWDFRAMILYNTIRYDAMRCDAMRCDAMRCDAIRCDAMRCNAMQCNAMQCNAMQCNAMQCNTMHWDAIRCNAIRCDAKRYNLKQAWPLCGARGLIYSLEARKQHDAPALLLCLLCLKMCGEMQ